MLERGTFKNSGLTSVFLIRAIGWINTSSDVSTLNSRWNIQVKMSSRFLDKRSVKTTVFKVACLLIEAVNVNDVT